MFGIIGALKSAWDAIQWLRKQKKEIETNAEAYFSEDRARAWRLNIERFFFALETGGDIRMPKSLRRIVKWVFGNTTVDNVIGRFGQLVMKSKKLADRDAKLWGSITEDGQEIKPG